MRARSIILTIAALIAFCNIATAQTIALGEKTPRFKNEKWLNGNRPAESDFTYIEFIHSASISCRRSAERIYAITSKLENVAFVLISHQKASEIDSWVTNFINEHAGVIIDDYNIRTSFGVKYAPYAVIINRNRKAIWFGNPQLLTNEKLNELLTLK